MTKISACLGASILLLFNGSVTAAPPVPTALSPATGSSIFAGDSVTFEWTRVDQATTFDFLVLDIGDSGYFYRDRNVAATACNATSCSVTITDAALSRLSTYVWRVAAKNSTGRSRFSHSRFDVVPAASPDTPLAITPSAGDNLVVGQPLNFDWLVSKHATSYDFYLYERTASRVVYRNRNVLPDTNCDLAQCSYSVDNTLLPVAQNHVWRVAASNSQGKSSFSHTGFNVVPKLPPSTPQPLAPSLNQVLPSRAPITFRWLEVENALTYDFYVWNRNTEDGVFRDVSVPASNCANGTCSTTLDFQLPVGLYVWRVAAKGTGGRSVFSHTKFSIAESGQVSLDEYELVFSDEFTGSQLDSSKWNTALIWGPYLQINNEQQLYVDTLHMHSDFPWTPFEFTGDTLRINAVPTTANLQPPVKPPENSPLWNRPGTEYRYNPDYTPADVEHLSGIITTSDSFKMTHGYLETRVKLPRGKGLWPAFWMLPTHYVEDVPEIDIMEFLGDNVTTVYNTYHYFDVPAGWKLVSTPSYPVVSDDWTQEFHTFGVEWSPRRLRWYVNGVVTYEFTGEEGIVPKQSMHILSNIAVGGNWPGDADDTTPFPATYEIDYIRAYKRRMPDVLDLSQYQLMFEDNFDGYSLDAEKWNTHYPWGPYLTINSEEQYNVDALGSDAGLDYSPFSLNDGKLTITARAADDPNGVTPPLLPELNDSIWTSNPSFQRNTNYLQGDYTSGILTSYDAFKFAHGYAEIRAKIPKGDGLFPSFWMLNAYYVGPLPEINIMGARGEQPNQIFHTYHRKNSDGVTLSTGYMTDNNEPVDGYSDGFHTYGVRWEHDKITWYVDGTPMHSYTGADLPYQLMYVSLNLSVGGSLNIAAADPAAFPAEFVIDYVRVWQEDELP